MIKKIAIGIAAVFALLLLLGACLGEGEPIASGNGGQAVEQAQPEPAPEPAPEPEPEPEPEFTFAQENAIRAAQSYIEMTAFSKKGLIEQLQYDNYSARDAKFAVNHIKANWKRQAVLSAKGYLDMTAFSRDDLVGQLKYDGYTQAQAEHGANVAYKGG